MRDDAAILSSPPHELTEEERRRRNTLNKKAARSGKPSSSLTPSVRAMIDRAYRPSLPPVVQYFHPRARNPVTGKQDRHPKTGEPGLWKRGVLERSQRVKGRCFTGLIDASGKPDRSLSANFRDSFCDDEDEDDESCPADPEREVARDAAIERERAKCRDVRDLPLSQRRERKPLLAEVDPDQPPTTENFT